MKSRGYTIAKYDVLNTAYSNRPTAYQMACHDAYMLRLVKEERDCNALQQLLLAGISSNPCNMYGESLLHTICRLGNIPCTSSTSTSTTTNPVATSAGDTTASTMVSCTTSSSLSYQMLRILLDVGHCDVTNCVDDFGRTPLHDACWSIHPCWDTITTLLSMDRTLLLLRDCRGALPLSYIPKQREQEWLEYLSTQKDYLFPVLTVPLSDPNDEMPPVPSPLVQQQPNSRPVQDPTHALSLELARMVASGRITPQEVAILLEDSDDDDDSSSTDDDDEDDDEHYDYNIEDDSSTLLSAEGNYFPTCSTSPKVVMKHANDEGISSDDDDSDDSEGSSSDDDDESESEETYSEFEDILLRLQQSKCRSEGIIGIARPQYGNMIVAESMKSVTTPPRQQQPSEQLDASMRDNLDTAVPMVSIRVPNSMKVDHPAMASPSSTIDKSVTSYSGKPSLSVSPTKSRTSTRLLVSDEEEEQGLLEFSV
jgi:ankyrin repeat protein